MPLEIRGVVNEYLARFFQGLFREIETVVSVGTTLTQLCGENVERAGLVLINVSTTQVSVAPSQKVTTSNGIILLSGGGGLYMNVFQDITLPSRPWHAISTVAAQNVYVLEIVRDTVAQDPTARRVQP